MTPSTPSLLQARPDATTDEVGLLQRPEVLRAPAADIQRRDQVAFVSPDGDRAADVAGGVTAVRRDPRGATVFVVVENRVHVLPSHHPVIIVRGPTIRLG